MAETSRYIFKKPASGEEFGHSAQKKNPVGKAQIRPETDRQSKGRKGVGERESERERERERESE